MEGSFVIVMEPESAMLTVDIHSHFFPRLSREQGKYLDRHNGPWLDIRKHGKGMIMTGEQEFRPVHAALWCAKHRMEDMDRCGVDVQVVCATPLLFGYSKSPRVAHDWAQMINDKAVELCSENSSRLKPMAQVPLQSLDLSTALVTKAKADGHVGVQIGNHVGDHDLNHPHLVEFLCHCAAEDMPVLVHPWDMFTTERMKKYMLQWLVAMPAETQLSILSLILSGTFERLPDTLKICFAHGGGSFAYLLGRVDNAWEYRDIVRQDCPYKPSSYTNRFFVDSAVFSHEALRLLTDVMGDHRIMLGTDYPFPLGEQELASLVRSHPELDKPQKGRMLGLNAKEFFSIDHP